MTVLTPYNIFIADTENKLWAVMKDGRVVFIKKISSFACLSADFKSFSTVSFDGERTSLFLQDFSCDEGGSLLFKQWGYWYYPSFFQKGKSKLLAVIKADLLNPKGTGDLIIFQKKRTQFHPLIQLKASVKPLQWDLKTGDLYYISAKKALVRTDGKHGEILSADSDLFALSYDGTHIAFYHNDTIHVLSLQTGSLETFYAFDVKTLTFSADGKGVYFSSSKENKFNLYLLDRATGEVNLVFSHAFEIIFLSPAI